MTIKSGSGQACAACKYQRRRCTTECLLAPFFPADQFKMFQNVHRLFGVKNIQNLLKELGPDQHQKAMAMKSIKFHAAMRDKYPVYGCLFEIHQLSYQIQAAAEELQAVLQQLAYYRRQQHEMSSADDYISELQLGMAPPGNGAVAALVQDDNHPQSNGLAPLPQVSSSDSGNGDYNINYLDFKENNNNNNNVNIVNSLCQQPFSNSNEDNNPDSFVMQSHLMMQQPPKQEMGQDYNDMKRFFDNIDDTQSYIGSNEAYESSLESSTLKDSRSEFVEQMDENELKSAAACFSLTSSINAGFHGLKLNN